MKIIGITATKTGAAAGGGADTHTIVVARESVAAGMRTTTTCPATGSAELASIIDALEPRTTSADAGGARRAGGNITLANVPHAKETCAASALSLPLAGLTGARSTSGGKRSTRRADWPSIRSAGTTIRCNYPSIRAFSIAIARELTVTTG